MGAHRSAGIPSALLGAGFASRPEGILPSAAGETPAGQPPGRRRYTFQSANL